MIKTVPSEFVQDADRLARFKREAKPLAPLNHPNIAAIYGLEEFGGTRFLVPGLVEGDTLADRLSGAAIPVKESLKLALQIIEPLEVGAADSRELVVQCTTIRAYHRDAPTPLSTRLADLPWWRGAAPRVLPR